MAVPPPSPDFKKQAIEADLETFAGISKGGSCEINKQRAAITTYTLGLTIWRTPKLSPFCRSIEKRRALWKLVGPMNRYSAFYRSKLAFAGFCLLFGPVGCNLVTLVQKTTVNEFQLWTDSFYLNKRMHSYVKKAWQEYKGSTPGLGENLAFKHGFLDGFYSYLDAGGKCVPPATPPRKYWRYSSLTPEGAQLVRDYMEGYREGTLQAKESNYREILLVPVLIAPDDTNAAMSVLAPNRFGDNFDGSNPMELLPPILPNPKPTPKEKTDPMKPTTGPVISLKKEVGQ